MDNNFLKIAYQMIALMEMKSKSPHDNLTQFLPQKVNTAGESNVQFTFPLDFISP